MKILKGAALALAAAVAAFFAVGLMIPSLDYQSRVPVGRPRARTWEVFVDEKNLPRWIPNFKSLERLGGEPHAVGSRYRMTVVENGKEYALAETTTAFTPPERCAFHLDAGVITNEVDIRFIDRGDGTEIVAKSHVVGSNPFWRALIPFTKSIFIRNDRQSYDQLKKLIEEGAP